MSENKPSAEDLLRDIIAARRAYELNDYEELYPYSVLRAICRAEDALDAIDLEKKETDHESR